MPTALLLNASYEPLRVIPLTRAINLLLARKAVVEEEGTALFRSARTELRSPVVIRLTSMVKVPYRTRIPLTRANLIARDHGTCQYCHAHVGARGTIDHVQPRSRGGQHRWENVVLACPTCNGRKDDHTLDELGWKLTTIPWAPKGTTWIIVGLHKVQPAWEPYLTTAGAGG